MIRICKPIVLLSKSKARLIADVYENDIIKTIWFEVEEKYADYLCYERSDAFVVGLLNYAMRHGHDIECEAPIGEYLYYQITNYLIDSVYKGSKTLHKTNLIAKIDSSELPCANAVGTGISCGIDSFHVLAGNTDNSFMKHRLTHLAFNNVGSHGEGKRAENLYAARKEMVEKFSKEYNFELVESSSNIMDSFEQDHFLTHTYTSTFAILCLQKLYSVYYYASGRLFSDFSLKDTDRDCSFYDLLLADTTSTDKLRIYSEGATLSRLEKTKKVVNYEPSYDYLNVCVSTANNCGKCEKCIRTLLALDVLHALEHYSNVFDINYYKTHKRDYLKVLWVQTKLGNNVYAELYPSLKKELNVWIKIRGLLYLLKGFLINKSKGKKRTLLKSVYQRICRK